MSERLSLYFKSMWKNGTTCLDLNYHKSQLKDMVDMLTSLQSIADYFLKWVRVEPLASQKYKEKKIRYNELVLDKM